MTSSYTVRHHKHCNVPSGHANIGYHNFTSKHSSNGGNKNLPYPTKTGGASPARYIDDEVTDKDTEGRVVDTEPFESIHYHTELVYVSLQQ